MTNTLPDSAAKAIPTRYAGCHFRSRLEARWAVFFDHLGISWEYEPQGYTGFNGEHYLPDFVLPGVRPPTSSHRMYDGPNVPEFVGTFVEVKGSDGQLRSDAMKIAGAIEYKATPVAHGLLILGSVPRIMDADAVVSHTFLSWHKGVDLSYAHFGPKWSRDIDSDMTLIPSDDVSLGNGNTSEDLPDEATTVADIRQRKTYRRDTTTYMELPMPRMVAGAYKAARSARFEHGESGAS